GGRPQAGLTVYLIDPTAPKDKPGFKSAETNEEGAFSFKDLEPKQYRLFCQKQATQRKADTLETVESGQTKEVLLEVLRYRAYRMDCARERTMGTGSRPAHTLVFPDETRRGRVPVPIVRVVQPSVNRSTLGWSPRRPVEVARVGRESDRVQVG